LAGQGAVHLDRWRNATNRIDQCQNAKPSTIIEAIAHEVHAPALVGRHCSQRYYPDGTDSLARALEAQPETLQPIQALHSFMVDLPAIAPQQHIETTIAVAHSGGGKIAKPHA